ncbi:MAG: DNRLRE domain-containing protein, partial [Anaerolineales bacterium]|nr:DNRLRE domain-containing protein [Anaerolineales bacterium]
MERLQTYFTAKPNWEEGVATIRHWFTTLTTSKKNLEQRAGLKTYALRGLNYRVDAISQAQSAYIYRKLLKDMHKLIGIPVWSDGALIMSVVSITDSLINVDSTDFMEYETFDEFLITGGIITDDWDTYEIVAVKSFTATTMRLKGNAQNDWPVGTMIFPILPARLEMTQEIDVVTDYYSGVGISVKESFEQSTTTSTTNITTTTSTSTTSITFFTTTSTSTTTTCTSTTTTSTSTTTTAPPQTFNWGDNDADEYNNRMEDTWINGGSTSQNNCTVIVAFMGDDNPIRSLLRFKPNQDIAGAIVTNALLYFYADQVVQDHNVSAYRVLQDWVCDEVTWNNYSTGNAWNTAGCAAANDSGVDDDASFDRHATAEDTVLCSNGVTGWYSLDITDLVQDWVDGDVKEYGVLLQSDDETINGQHVRFQTREWTPEGTRPYLEITFNGTFSTTTTTTTT